MGGEQWCPGPCTRTAVTPGLASGHLQDLARLWNQPAVLTNLRGTLMHVQTRDSLSLRNKMLEYCLSDTCLKETPPHPTPGHQPCLITQKHALVTVLQEKWSSPYIPARCQFFRSYPVVSGVPCPWHRPHYSSPARSLNPPSLLTTHCCPGQLRDG